MHTQDIRWQQRFANYKKALAQLSGAVLQNREHPLSDLEKQGLVQAFEYTFELGWNTLKDYLTFQGITDLVGSRDTIREAFSRGLIDDGEGWMGMLVDRNRSSHTYNEELAEEITTNILTRHFPLLTALRQKMEQVEAT